MKTIQIDGCVDCPASYLRMGNDNIYGCELKSGVRMIEDEMSMNKRPDICPLNEGDITLTIK
jgi:hypothetical protein